MPRNAYHLAAFAAAALPRFEPTGITAVPTPRPDMEVATVADATGRQVMVTCPGTTAAGLRLEKDLTLAGVLAGHELGDLVSAVRGSVKLPEGGRAVVTDVPQGRALMLDELLGDEELIGSLGEVLARLHDVSPSRVEAAGAEAFTAASTREYHRIQFRRARDVETIPPAVVQRWEQLLAAGDLWEFTPCFVHGDLSEESLLTEQGRISAILDLSSARIGDPAADLAWLRSAMEPERFAELLASYRRHRRGAVDAHLGERAQAVGEFAVVEWLLHGIDAEDEEIIADARGMLADLDEEIAQIAREEAEEAYADLDEHESER